MESTKEREEAIEKQITEFLEKYKDELPVEEENGYPVVIWSRDPPGFWGVTKEDGNYRPMNKEEGNFWRSQGNRIVREAEKKYEKAEKKGRSEKYLNNILIQVCMDLEECFVKRFGLRPHIYSIDMGDDED